MKKTLFLLCCIATAYISSGQTYNERIEIKGGTELWANVTREMYLYPTFREGTVHYKNGQQFKRAMNYNRFLATVQFIDERKDTLAIANEEAVQTINIGDDKFIYNGVCLAQIASEGEVSLFKNEKMRVADIRQVGAYGKSNSTTSMESANQVYTWMNSFQLSPSETLLLAKVSSYFIRTGKGDVVPAGRKNILKLFSKNEDAVKEFIKKENTNFNQEKDLLSLTKYLSSL